MSYESASAAVVLILAALQARKLRKPQPFLSPAEAPLRKSDLLLASGSCLSTSWEDWHQLSPAAQGRPLVANERKVCVILFGKPLGEITPEMDDPRMTQKELLRQQKWDSLPRELKLAIRRVHVNLGHATTAQMLKAMRISRASEVAIRAVRLFQCPDCPRVQAPRPPHPSKLPLAEEFNVQIGLDVFQAKDADGQSWSWFNVLCQATTFQVCSLLADTHANRTSSAVLQAFETSWTSWAVTQKAAFLLTAPNTLSPTLQKLWQLRDVILTLQHVPVHGKLGRLNGTAWRYLEEHATESYLERAVGRAWRHVSRHQCNQCSKECLGSQSWIQSQSMGLGEIS